MIPSNSTGVSTSVSTPQPADSPADETQEIVELSGQALTDRVKQLEGRNHGLVDTDMENRKSWVPFLYIYRPICNALGGFHQHCCCFFHVIQHGPKASSTVFFAPKGLMWNICGSQKRNSMELTEGLGI